MHTSEGVGHGWGASGREDLSHSARNNSSRPHHGSTDPSHSGAFTAESAAVRNSLKRPLSCSHTSDSKRVPTRIPAAAPEFSSSTAPLT